MTEADITEAAGVVPSSQNFKWEIPEHFNFAADVVDHWAAKGNGEALIWSDETGDERRFRFADVSRLSRNLAAALNEAGVGKGDRIVVVLPRIPEWQIAIVAALRIGAVPIPCIEMLKPHEIAYRVDHSGAKAIVCRAEHADVIESGIDGIPIRFSVGPRPGWLDVRQAMETDRTCDPVLVGREDPAIMYYTSGSTGHPKGVLHASRSLYAWRVSAEYWLDLHPGDRMWCTADTGWSKAGTSILFGPWSRGACSIFYNGPFDAVGRLRMIHDYRVNVFCAAATELARLLRQDLSGFDLSSMRRTVSAGEAVSPAISLAWQEATGVEVAEAYGQTETLMTALTIPGIKVRAGSMGVSAPGLRLEVVDDDGEPAAQGTVGNIALKAPCPQLMLGYWNDTEKTAEAYIDSRSGKWFRTGDLGFRDADGYLWYHSRADDVINSSGYRIGPTEVESALLEHPAVLEVAVVGVADLERGQVVKAFVVLTDGYTGSDELTTHLQEHVKKSTAPYKYPRAIEYTDSLPKGPTGKILRRALRDEENSRRSHAKEA